jgi:hypothetical protein
MEKFNVIDPTGENKEVYKKLIERWWEWVFKPNCDDVKFPDVAFLRTDIIGDPRPPPGNSRDVPALKRNIDIPKNKQILVPIYYSHFVHDDPFGDGSPCGNTDRCRSAAKADYNKLSEKWANIKVDGGEQQDIVKDLDSYYFETNPFGLKVSDYNNLKREEGFHLEPRANPYQGICVGNFLLMKFDEGRYQMDFGGIASNYFTRSVYDITVK